MFFAFVKMCSFKVPVFIFVLVLVVGALDACPTIVTKAQWGGKAATSSSKMGSTPAIVIVHHADTPSCTTYAACENRVRNIQQYHMSNNGWADVGYNFLIGGDGTIFQGRGWGVIGAHATNWNSRSIGICLIGSFQSSSPTAVQMRSLESLIACGVNSGNLAANYKLVGHRQARSTACPGDRLFTELRGMPNFAARFP